MDKANYHKNYYCNNKERILAQKRIYRLVNLKKIHEYDATPARRFKQYKYNAKHHKLVLDIILEDFMRIIEQPCYYCGGVGYGIDRLDSKVGYTKDNIVSCCSKCNYMKQELLPEDFIKQCRTISNRFI